MKNEEYVPSLPEKILRVLGAFAFGGVYLMMLAEDHEPKDIAAVLMLIATLAFLVNLALYWGRRLERRRTTPPSVDPHGAEDERPT